MDNYNTISFMLYWRRVKSMVSNRNENTSFFPVAQGRLHGGGDI